MEYTEYITTEGERWDTVAYRAYGDAGRIDGIIRANPGIPVHGTLPAGTRLRVPVEAVPGADNNPLLPPWKRNRG